MQGMNTSDHTSPAVMRPRPKMSQPLQLTVLDNASGRRVCTFPSRIDVSLETCYREFEEEAWRLAVAAQRVDPAARHLYSFELQ